MVPRAPFPRLHESGRWGVSHARPPTESRPGTSHYSLVLGGSQRYYKGWRGECGGVRPSPQPVIGGVGNRSSIGRALFSKGIPHVRSRMYAEELEDFAASSNHAALDEWVFDRAIEVLVGNVTEDEQRAGATLETERSALEGDKVVFLLHLLGLDSAGTHTSQVEKGTPKTSGLLTRVFEDSPRRSRSGSARRMGVRHSCSRLTGMSNRGAHGDGDRMHRNPFVAWGAGIASTASRTPVEIACVPRGKDAPTPGQSGVSKMRSGATLNKPMWPLWEHPCSGSLHPYIIRACSPCRA